MQIYATEEDYLKYGDEVPENFKILAAKASRITDVLTYNRIAKTGFDNLTDFQIETIVECCCEIIKFYNENEDMLESVFNSYSINGVSMQFDKSQNVCVKNGCVLLAGTYERLMSTGLCYGGFGI